MIAASPGPSRPDARSPRPRDRIQSQQIIQRDPARSERQYREFHRGPRQVEIHPAVGDGQLDDRGHAEQPQRGLPRAEAEHQQDGQGDLADRRDVGHQLRGRIGIFGPEEMQLEFVGEQRLGPE